MQQLWQEELFDGDDDSYCRRYAPDQQVDYSVGSNGGWRAGTVVLSLDEMVKCAPTDATGKHAQAMTQWVALDGDHVTPVHMQSVNDRESLSRFYSELANFIIRQNHHK